MLCGCGKNVTPYVKTGFAFDTVVSFTYYSKKDEAAVEKAFGFYADIFRKMELAGIDRIGGVYVLTAAGSDGAGRGSTLTNVHASEAAFWKNMKAFQLDSAAGSAMREAMRG